MNDRHLLVVIVLIPFLFLYQQKCLTNWVKDAHSLDSPCFFVFFLLKIGQFAQLQLMFLKKPDLKYS